MVTFAAGQILTADDLADYSVLTSAWTAYSPSWTALTTNPAIGDGAITARFMQVGKTVFVAGRILMGSTTTFGTGAWRLSLPVTAQNSINGAGSVWFFDASVAGNRKPGAIWHGTASLMAFSGDTGDVDATNPFTWAATDQLRFTLTYEAA